MFFLTEIDPRAKTEGARDPLGIQTVWSGIGRTVISNLTTQTTSLIDFRVLLIGCYLAEQVGNEADPFIVWEQLCAQVRLNGDKSAGFRGVDRARRKASEARFTVSSDPRDHLLAHQRTNGIWGLYVAAAQRSGLVDSRPDGATLSKVGRELVELSYAPCLQSWGTDQRALVRLLRDGGRIAKAALDSQERYSELASMLLDRPGPDEKRILHSKVVEGETVERVWPVQAGLATAIGQHGWDPRAARATLTHITDSLKSDYLEPLRDRLRAILAAEQMLSVAGALFSFVTAHKGSELDDVADLAARAWKGKLPLTKSQLGLLEIEASEGRLNAPVGTAHGRLRWIQIATALHERDYRAVLPMLTEQNCLVSQDRGAPVGWVSLDDNRKLLVQRQDGSGELPARDSLNSLWTNSYFISNLAMLVRDLEYA